MAIQNAQLDSNSTLWIMRLKHMFSVIIPTFNRCELLRATLDSIFRQTFTGYEVIVIDDGSTDGTLEFLASMKDQVQVLTQQNSGPGTARNSGARVARGDYLAFLDSDDLWFPWTLQTYAEVIAKNDNPAFVTGRHCLFSSLDDTKEVEQGGIRTIAFPDYFASFQEWRWFGVSSFVIRKDAFLAVGGFTPGRINFEDAELAMRLGTSKGFVHVESPVMFGYRVHGGNVTLDSEKCSQGLGLLVAQELNKKFPGGRSREKERWKIISRHVRPFAIDRAQNGSLYDALKWYWRVLPEAITSGRIRFLVGLPAIVVLAVAKRVVSRITGRRPDRA